LALTQPDFAAFSLLLLLTRCGRCGVLLANHLSRMTRRLWSKKGAAIYAQRKVIVEPVNGQI
jgi:hypothetical protein